MKRNQGKEDFGFGGTAGGDIHRNHLLLLRKVGKHNGYSSKSAPTDWTLSLLRSVMMVSERYKERGWAVVAVAVRGSVG